MTVTSRYFPPLPAMLGHYPFFHGISLIAVRALPND
jgi:hypothetical protein